MDDDTERLKTTKWRTIAESFQDLALYQEKYIQELDRRQDVANKRINELNGEVCRWMDDNAVLREHIAELKILLTYSKAEIVALRELLRTTQLGYLGEGCPFCGEPVAHKENCLIKTKLEGANA